MNKRVFTVWVILPFLAGCYPGMWRSRMSAQTDAERFTLDAASELDKVAHDLEEYGSITASAAAILRSPGSEFQFDLDLTAKQLFAERPIQGFSAIRSYEELAIRVAAAVALLRTGQVNEANKALAETLVGADQGGLSTTSQGGATAQGNNTQGASPGSTTSGGNTQADTTGNSQTDLPKPPALPPGAPRGVTGGFSPPLAVPDPSALGLSMRDLIKRVFDDHTTLMLLKWLSNPDTDELGDNKQLYAAVLNVNIRPGRLTYRGYIGEIDIFPEYVCQGQTAKGEETLRGVPLPISFAVFPSIDSQVLDLRTSRRNQFALATLLEAAFPAGATGLQGAGAIASDYMKRIEQDAATLSAVNTVVGYNASGRHFGWHFSPSFVAQADPAEKETKPASILQAQSFPALVLILAEKDHLTLSIGGSGPDRDKGKCFITDNDPGFAQPPYDQLSFHYASRWLRAPSPRADESIIPWRSTLNRLLHPRLREDIEVEWGLRLERARVLLDDAREEVEKDEKRKDWPYATQALAKRLNMLEAASVGADVVWNLPTLPDLPEFGLDEVSPQYGWTDRKSWFIISGKGFKATKNTKGSSGSPAAAFKVFIGGQKAKTELLEDNTAIVSVTPCPTPNDSNKGKAKQGKGKAIAPSPRLCQQIPNSDTPVDVTVYRAGYGAATLKNGVSFKLQGSPKGKPPTPKARIEISWDRGADGKPVLKSLAVYDDVKAAEVLKAISQQAPVSHADVNVDLDVKATGKK